MREALSFVPFPTSGLEENFMPGSCLMIGLQGLSLLKEEKDFIVSNNIAGVVLFKRNIQSFKQIYKLCLELKSLTKPSPLIAIDMEGGEVNRFSHLKKSYPWPPPKILRTFKPHQIFVIAKAMARQLHALGIDINFAPVVDLPLMNNPLLTNRVFGNSKEEILKHASYFIEGLIAGNVIPCLKHFPGHGGVSKDSHKTLPKDNRQMKDLKSQFDIFQTFFEKHPSCWIMTAHVEFPNIDKKPATFSKVLLKTKLRNQQGFKGLLVSDDIDMKALKRFSLGECFFQAMKGGCDLIITCQKKESPKEIIKYFEQNPHKKKTLQKELKLSSKKILEIRKKLSGPLFDFKSVEKELSKFQPEKLFSALGLNEKKAYC